MRINKIGFTDKEYVRALNRIINRKISSIYNKIETSERFKKQQTVPVSNNFVLAYTKKNGKPSYFIFLSNIEANNEVGDGSKLSDLQESLGEKWLGAWPTEEQIKIMYEFYKLPHSLVGLEEGAEFAFLFGQDNNGIWKKTDLKKTVHARLVSVMNLPETELKSVLIYLIKTNRYHGYGDELLREKDLRSIISTLDVTTGTINLSETDIQSLNISEDLRRSIETELLGNIGFQPGFTSAHVKEYLKKCDEIRAGILPYDESYFQDETQGLWDFWNSEELPYSVAFAPGAEIIRTRDPRKDMDKNKGCVIAIDFGTSSTVVVKYDPAHPNEPKQICVGDQKTEKYENPTLLLVNQYQKFLQDYYGKDCRPYTKWNDLMVSHSVKERMSAGASGNEHSKAIMSHIKQWAAEDNSKLSIIPVAEKEPIELKSLKDLLEKENMEEFNPIEIYAYFLGLNLNNRHEGYGIYINYQLSYPATYTEDIRKFITDSFRKGLRKSIPDAIKDEEITVEMKISEPEAYAITAMKKYKFEPEEGEKVKYAIFDFGGGTSDFAYGYWSAYSGDDDAKEWVLETIDINGEQFLGGENILDGLAFEVFSHPRNLPQLIKQPDSKSGGQKIFKFAYGIEKKQYGKVENKYLSQNFYGKNNLTALIEYNNGIEKDDQGLFGFGLRAFWENQEKYFKDFFAWEQKSNDMVLLSYEIARMLELAHENETAKGELEKLLEKTNKYENDLDKQEITSTLEYIRNQYKDLFENKSSQDIYTIKLPLYYQSDLKCDSELVEIKVSLKDMYKYFSDEIQSGVDSFFCALKTAFADDYNGRINIFLAGNASKSPILGKLLLERIKKETSENVTFNLFNRFDSEDYFDKIKEVGEAQGWSQIDINKAIEKEQEKHPNFQPTGKTGVAFGIISMNNIDFRRKNDNRNYFKYYLGRKKTKKGYDRFIPLKNEKPFLGEWILAFSYSPDPRDLYYTTNANCIDGEQSIEIASLCQLKFDEIKEDEKIFIQIAGINEIYCVPAKDVVDAENKISELSSPYSKKITLV